MPILTTQFNDLVRNATIHWHEGYLEVPERARLLYNVEDNPWSTSEHSQIDPPGFARRKSEGGSYAIGSPIQGYSLTLTKSRIGLSDAITWEMRKYDRYGQMIKKMRGLGNSTAMRLELDLTHLFTFGLQGSTYTNMDGETVNTQTGDGVQIFSNSHTITGASTNVDNLNGTTAFSRTGLEAAERLFNNMINNNSVKVVPQPDTIITSAEPAIVNAVKEFMRSTTAPDTTDRADNVYKGKYNHIILPLLETDLNGGPDSTARYYWMLADLKNKDSVVEFSEMPTFTMARPEANSEDFLTDNWWMKSSAAYSYGILDYKWICGSAATSV